MMWMGVLLAFSLQVVRETTVVQTDTVQVFSATIAGSRSGLPYAAILNTMGGNARLIRSAADTLMEFLPTASLEAINEDGYVLGLLTPSPDTLVFRGIDPLSATFQDTLPLPPGWQWWGGEIRPCDLPGSPGQRFCALLSLYDGTNMSFRLLAWEFTGSDLNRFQDLMLDTVASTAVYSKLHTLPHDVPVSTWADYPTLLVHQDNPPVDSCYVRFIHPTLGETAAWSYACPNGAWNDQVLAHSRSADTLLVDVLHTQGDTTVRFLLEATSSGLIERRRDTLVIQPMKALSSFYSATEGDFLCVVGTDPTTGDRMAYGLPLDAGPVLQANITASVGWIAPTVWPTGQDDGACLFLDPSGPQFFGIAVSGGSLTLQSGRPADGAALYGVETKPVGGLPDGGTLWWSSVDPITGQVRIGAANIGEVATGGLTDLVDDTLWLTGARMGAGNVLQVLQDTLFLGIGWVASAPEVVVWDTSFTGIYERSFGSYDTTLFGAPWILWVNASQTLLSLDRATGSLRPGSFSLSTAMNVFSPTADQVREDTVFFCYRDNTGEITGVLLDVSGFTVLDSFSWSETGISFARCRWDGNLLAMAGSRPTGDSTRVVVYDRAVSGVIVDTVLEGNLEKMELWGNTLGMVRYHSSSSTRDYHQCTVGSSLSCLTWSQPMTFTYHALFFDGTRTYIGGSDGTSTFLYVLDNSLSLVEQRDLAVTYGWVNDLTSLDTLYGAVFSGSGGTYVRWFALGEAGSLGEVFLPNVSVMRTSFVDQGGGRGQWYLAGAVSPYGAQIPYVAVVGVDATTPVAEGRVLSRGVRVVMRGPWLVLEGRGTVDVGVFNALGRRVMGYRGEVRGVLRLGRLPVRGVYVVKDRVPGGGRKILWVGR